MGKVGRRLKRRSTSTDVESADHKSTKHLQITERELQNSETDVNPGKRKKKSESKRIDEDDLEPKKTSEKKEMKKLRKSFKEMTETLKNLQDFFMSKADLPGISLKELFLSMGPDTSSKEEEPLEITKEELAACGCNYKTEDSDGNNKYSVFVRGLDTSLPRDDIKNALRKHFESCGCEVTRVYVPIECLTGAPLGFAFIDVDDEQKALELGGGYMGRCWFYVMMATNQPEYHEFPNFTGCNYCGTFRMQRRAKRFLSRRRY
ncbi:RNA-binding domain superfamily [Arabidopsis thaliana x Arabidopsis arenosa]|uniref:RNA-binding domain superfamily n=1 Tax=Arabidopsis thaliana x Arabidopsis arenosa TaxID=1240361 RepID=A0A8T1Z515_9BRAS|nr:RNA-binding domain superfamily [Arabidopsis thaliana x Arabidopsis arenosa]